MQSFHHRPFRCGSPRGAAVAALALLAPTVQAQVTTYGSGVNPPGSLVVTSGVAMVGESFTVGVSNTASATSPAGLAFLSFATAPDPAFPAGTVLPGFGLAFPGAPGELLLGLASPNPFATLGPLPWAGGAAAPASFALSVPLVPSLSGLTIYLQGTLLDLASGPSIGVTNGLAATLSAPTFPGLVLIQPGTFLMGSDAPAAEPYWNSSVQKPVHHVTISKPFWMGQYEVTQAEYEAITGANPSSYVGANLPVHRTTWFDAMAYCDALTSAQAALGKIPAGYAYRLPTEAEWEYACRAGTTSEYHYGPGLLCDQASFFYSYFSGPPASCTNLPPGPSPVGSFAPNAWGLHDMHGNVAEWCMDSFGPYTASAKVDPFVTGISGRVFRGGGRADLSDDCRTAVRNASSASTTMAFGGFRVVLAPVLVP